MVLFLRLLHAARPFKSVLYAPQALRHSPREDQQRNHVRQLEDDRGFKSGGGNCHDGAANLFCHGTKDLHWGTIMALGLHLTRVHADLKGQWRDNPDSILGSQSVEHRLSLREAAVILGSLVNTQWAWPPAVTYALPTFSDKHSERIQKHLDNSSTVPVQTLPNVSLSAAGTPLDRERDTKAAVVANVSADNDNATCEIDHEQEVSIDSYESGAAADSCDERLPSTRSGGAINNREEEEKLQSDLRMAQEDLQRALALAEVTMAATVGLEKLLSYDEERGDEKDVAAALALLKRAAAHGDAEAAHNIGVAFQRGMAKAAGCMENSHRRAVKWFRRAAALGYAASAYNLALYYRDGIGGVPIGELVWDMRISFLHLSRSFISFPDLAQADKYFNLVAELEAKESNLLQSPTSLDPKEEEVTMSSNCHHRNDLIPHTRMLRDPDAKALYAMARATLPDTVYAGELFRRAAAKGHAKAARALQKLEQVDSATPGLLQHS